MSTGEAARTVRSGRAHLKNGASEDVIVTRVRNGKRVEVADEAHVTPTGAALPVIGETLRLKGAAGALSGVESRIHVGDCREILPSLPEVKRGELDLVFADPPFNWGRGYDAWNDAMSEREYLAFTYDWIDLCVRGLRAGGSMWINIPDSWAAEIVCYMKGRGVVDPREGGAGKPPCVMVMQNWCVWHFRFGQNATERFISSKVHALYFVKAGAAHTWNPLEVLEQSDRAAIYGDPRTQSKKDGMPAGKRVPMDVWYGQFWGRVQGNSKERRHYHDNQLPEVYLERVVRACSNAGDCVLDPFLGSGTTGVIAHALGRTFIGCEFSPENAARAYERMRSGPVRLGVNKDASTAIFKKRSGFGTRSGASRAEE